MKHRLYHDTLHSQLGQEPVSVAGVVVDSGRAVDSDTEIYADNRKTNRVTGASFHRSEPVTGAGGVWVQQTLQTASCIH